jgi:response regulator RpfG family c-di-GMP phosphodiesterase
MSERSHSGWGVVALSHAGSELMSVTVFPEDLTSRDAPPSTIVAVDDVATNLEVYSRVLKRLPNVRIVCFTSSASGLEWCRQNDFDVLLLDYQMPAPNGLEFAKRLRKMPGKIDIPILMITGAAELEVRHTAIEIGVSDFFLKPIDPIEFLARAKNLLLLRARGRYLQDQTTWLNIEVQRAIDNVVGREEETIDRLTRATEYRDATIGQHLVRMSLYASRLAASMGLSSDDQRLIHLAAPLHDIGKVAIPDHVLLKSGPLTDEERKIVERHPLDGHDILKDSKSSLLQLGAEITLTHHEWWDGSGYPMKLAGENIPLAGRIVGLCDVFDALVSLRPHKQPWSFVDAVGYIESRNGTQFDPTVVSAFKHVTSDFITIKNDNPDDTRNDTIRFSASAS